MRDRESGAGQPLPRVSPEFKAVHAQRRGRGRKAASGSKLAPGRRATLGRGTASRTRGRRALRFFSAIVFATVLLAGVGFSRMYEPGLDSNEVLARARTWTEAGVGYDQLGYHEGYRTDCSGFVSMAWALPENLTTWRIPLVAEPIDKDELRAGDVLVDATSDDRHCVIFERWADPTRTRYWALESSGRSDIHRAVRRVMPYPYEINAEHYVPYRYVGMSRYYDEVPKSDRQPVH